MDQTVPILVCMSIKLCEGSYGFILRKKVTSTTEGRWENTGRGEG